MKYNTCAYLTNFINLLTYYIAIGDMSTGKQTRKDRSIRKLFHFLQACLEKVEYQIF